MNEIQTLIDERRAFEAQALGKSIEIFMALGLRDEAQDALNQMRAITMARQGAIDAARMVDHA